VREAAAAVSPVPLARMKATKVADAPFMPA
jgi:hypothetical protein